jgi:phenylacetic acid degradation operon negative regulatory protein
MTRQTIRRWIDRSLASDPPRAKSLLVTIFGDAIQPHGGSIRLKGLIDLLAPFGVNDRLVRTCVFRLVQEQWLRPSKHGRESSYRLTESGRRRFALAYDKIYRRPTATWDGRWMLVALPVNGIAEHLRPRLRRELEWLGMRQLTPNVFTHPQMSEAAVGEVLDRLHARQNLIVCRVIEFGAFGNLADLVKQSWDLEVVMKGYRSFLRRFGLLRRLAAERGRIEPQEWFVIRTLVIHAFRRIVLHDPLLPAELLPCPWIGARAYALTGEIYQSSLAASEKHLSETVAFVADDAKTARHLLRQRFRAR